MINQQAGYCILAIGIAMIIGALIIMCWDKTRKKKYTEIVAGKVIGHKWRKSGSMPYPCAVVEYTVDNRTHQCLQGYAAIYKNSHKYAECDWEIDDKYCLHRYAASRCKKQINPTEDLLPIGSAMDVYYVLGKPQKAYSGSLPSMKLLWLILGLTGLEIAVFGGLLAAILA